MGTLHDSNVCRLCATDSEDGFLLFGQNGKDEICTLINKYLPIEVKKDEKLPKKICSECRINVQNVVQFFNSVIRGQNLLLEKASKEEAKKSHEIDTRNAEQKKFSVNLENDRNIYGVIEDTEISFSGDHDIAKTQTDLPNELIECERCKKTFEWKKSPNYHNSNQHSDNKTGSISIEKCSSDNQEEKFQKEVIQTGNEANFAIKKCEICEKYPRNLKIHKFLAHNIGDNLKTFICDTCGEKFCHRNSIIYHIRSKHGENRFYNCNKCGKEFASTRLLNRHFKRIHTVVRLFECIQCHANFTAEDDLGAHLQSCTQSTFTCKVCKKTCQFGDTHKCRKDEKSTKEYRCSVCDKTFPYSSNLYRHQKLHSNERPYQCAKCNRKFPTLSRLNMHENEHKKEYSFKCDICQKSFVNNRILQVHSRRHTRIFPYQCDVCCKGFPDKCTLAKHTRVHTGERPYHCDLCEKSFADQSNFLRHKKGHSKENFGKLFKNRKNSTINQMIKKPNLQFKPRMEIDLSSMTYSDLKNEQKFHTQKPIPLTNHLPSISATKFSKMNILEKAIENVIHEYDNATEKQSNLSNTSQPDKTDNAKKCIYYNTTKQFLLLDSSRSDNVLLIPPKAPQNDEKLVSPLVLKSTKTPNSYVIVKKTSTMPSSSDAAKVIVIRSANKNKSKIIMQRPMKNIRSLPLPHTSTEDGSFDDDCEMENNQNQSPELYSYEEMAPSPTSSEYIDVEDLVATFTPNISFEEIGDLNDLVNTKIDL